MRNAYYAPKSELTMADIKTTVNSLNPIRITINKAVVWDDNYDDLLKYDAIFKLNYIVKEIKFKIVSFHHSYVEIKTT